MKRTTYAASAGASGIYRNSHRDEARLGAIRADRRSARRCSLCSSTGQKRTRSVTEHHYHAAIWIDHREARVFHFSPTAVETLVLHPDNPTRHIHHKANSIGSGHVSVDHEYLQAVAESVADA